MVVADKFSYYKGDIITSRLSLATWLVDDYTGKEPIGQVGVTIKEGNKEAIKNLSGYYIFSDLAGGSYNLEISSDLYFPEERAIDTSKINTSNITLQLDTIGPASGATSTELRDVSKLQKDDVVVFHNPSGDVEKKSITNIDAGTRTISWTGGLKNDFSALDSTIVALANPVVAILLKPKPSYPFPKYATLVRGSLIDSNKNPVADVAPKVASQNMETKSDKNGEFVLYFNDVNFKAVKNPISIDFEKNGNAKSADNITLEEGVMKDLGKIMFP